MRKSHLEGAKPLATFAADMIQLASSFSGKPRQASMAAYRQLLAENHVEEILQDVKQNKNLNRKKELPVWLPLAESFKNGTNIFLCFLSKMDNLFWIIVWFQ